MNFTKTERTEVLREGMRLLSHSLHPSCYSCQKSADKSYLVISHERGKNDGIVATRNRSYPWSSVRQISVVVCQTDIRGRLLDRYSVTINQVILATINCWSDDFNATTRNQWFSSSLINRNPLSRKTLLETQALNYRISREIYTSYAVTVEMLQINTCRKFIMGN